MSIEKFLCAYLPIINLLTFTLFKIDKMRAVAHSWRISEKTLLLFSGIGGLAGGWSAMFFFRHKIKDYSFLPFMLMLTLIWIIGIIVLLR